MVGLGLEDRVEVDRRDAEGREVVEPQIMTRRMLRELAMRRGVSYAEMLAKAEAEGVELPEE